MSKLHQSEIPATVFLIHKLTSSPIFDKLKCPGCQYEYPNEEIKRHLCPIFDNIKCKGCQLEYPNKAIKRHVFTYYKCKQYYEQNENDKKELNQILREKNLDDLDELPKPIHCFCIRNIGICGNCEL